MRLRDTDLTPHAAAVRRDPMDRVLAAYRVITRHVEQRPACEDATSPVVKSAAKALRPFRGPGHRTPSSV